MDNTPASQLPIEISCDVVKSKFDGGEDLVLIDCRERDEYELVHLDHAQLWPMSELESRTDELESLRGKPLVVFCHHGGRSLRVTHWLRRLGFASAQSMAGGIDRWASHIDPTLPRY